MSSSLDMQRGLPYRRRLFVARHRKRSLALRLLKPFSLALLLVASPAALAAWVLTSPEFTLQEVSIEGAYRVPEAWVRAELAPLAGRSLVELPAARAEQRLEAHPWVRSVTVRKRLPNRLEIDIEERRPAALLNRDGELYYVDLDGIAFAPFDPSMESSDLLLVSGSSRSPELREAMTLATRLVALDGELGAGLSEVEVLNHRDFRLYTAALPFPLVISSRDVGPRLESLHQVLPMLEHRLDSVGAIDLRFDRYIVVQPAKEPAKER